MSEETAVTEQSQTTQGEQSTGDATGQNKTAVKLFTQEEFDAKIDERMARERSKAEREAQKAKDEADQASMKEQAKWKELAEQHEAKVKELEPLTTTQAERLTQFEQLIAKQLETEIKDWPKELKDLDPGKETDLLARMAWVEKSRPLAQKLAAVPPAPGNGRLPRPAGAAGMEAADQAARQSQNDWTRRQF
jgi:hypothetical protein